MATTVQPRAGETLSSFRSRAGSFGIRGSEVTNIYNRARNRIQGSGPSLQGGGNAGSILQPQGSLNIRTITPRQLNATNTSSIPIRTSSSSQRRTQTTSTNKVSSEIARLQASIAALIAQQNAFVAAPSFDFQGNLARARSQAKSTIAPVYVQKLNNFLEKQKIGRAQKQKEADLAREGVQIDFKDRTQTIDRQRTRTNEDTEFAVGELNRQEGVFQEVEGRQFEEERLDEIANIVSGGGDFSGNSRRVLQAQIENRNLETREQVQQFANERRVQELGRTRSLEDLSASEEIATLNKDLALKNVKLSLDSFIENQGIEQKIERFSLQLEESQAIRQETQSIKEQGKQDFVTSLRNQGRVREAERFAELFL